VSLANDLLKQFEYMVESLELIPSDGGRFEVSVNGRPIFSKLESKRHAAPGEIIGLVTKIIEGQL
jgi:selenoprotein W-related protein